MDEPLTEEELLQHLDAKREELARTIGGSKIIPAEVKATMIEAMLRDEAARLTGTDPAFMEAMGLIRQHGRRKARKLYRDRSYRAALVKSSDVV